MKKKNLQKCNIGIKKPQVLSDKVTEKWSFLLLLLCGKIFGPYDFLAELFALFSIALNSA
jgi:hypothetical protein